MPPSQKSFQTLFRLRPLKEAKVSEISENTSASPVPPEERVNFHIGHPVQDDRLDQAYQSLILRAEFAREESAGDPAGYLIENGLWDESRRDEIELLRRAAVNSVAYMPRGGYLQSEPGKQVELIFDRLFQTQKEPLDYDTGRETGRKEITFVSGGAHEALRVFLHSLAHNLVHLPACIIMWHADLPGRSVDFPDLKVTVWNYSEEQTCLALESALNENPDCPTCLVLGRIPTEAMRRRLRSIGLQHPVLFVESNDAPNHLSLAREAGLKNSVIRMMTPAVIDPAMAAIPLVFAAGSDEFVRRIEAAHFELKGTPAAAEIELLAYALGERRHPVSSHESRKYPSPPRDLETTGSRMLALDFSPMMNLGERAAHKIENLLEFRIDAAERLASVFSRQVDHIGRKVRRTSGPASVPADPFVGRLPSEIMGEFFTHLDRPEWHRELEQAFLGAFLTHHPQYSPSHCVVVSGSARTALGLMGFHCGVREALVPDLSWSYEHCFPAVEAVPLGRDLGLDDRAFIAAVDQKIEADPAWRERGAVVLNNPHNASGQVFDEEAVSRLLRSMLERNIWVIDDLSYHKVAPSPDLRGPATLRQIANRMVKLGQLRAAQAARVVSVHSLSKTDCFAGARLAVVEIRHSDLHKKFYELARSIRPNIMALLLAYLFYHNSPAAVAAYWTLRNQVFHERMQALESSLSDLPPDRNPFRIELRRPRGSMYPHLVVRNLPAGISLDWLATGLSKRGIGLIPLTAFARLEEGFDLARQTFRLTLGGSDGADPLARKMRRVLIDLNRLIAEETSRYTRKAMPIRTTSHPMPAAFKDAEPQWERTAQNVLAALTRKEVERTIRPIVPDEDLPRLIDQIRDEYVPMRMHAFGQRFNDRLQLAAAVVSGVSGSSQGSGTGKAELVSVLERELYKQSLGERQRTFCSRLFDRTVHPTQMYGLRVERMLDGVIDDILHRRPVSAPSAKRIGVELLAEFLGENVAVRSVEEGDELITDLRSLQDSEDWALWRCGVSLPLFLSFWGDWDGSSRPSGQGHRLVAAALLENVIRLSRLLNTVIKTTGSTDVEPGLRQDIRKLESDTQAFWSLLNKITALTNQLEKRYQHVLPFGKAPGKWRRAAIRAHLARDPVTSLWQHNDRLEKRMRKWRTKRLESLEFYFGLNKRLRKTLFRHLDRIADSLNNAELAYAAGQYRSTLRRFALTPRIHQKMVTSSDQFAIDTTVHNMTEINSLSGRYGDPGLVLALQVSFSTDPEAFIHLERKLRSAREEVLRNNPDADIPTVWIVPLFEDIETLRHIEAYLDRVWEYAVQSRRMDRTAQERLSEMICELFIAGSDLSQQVGQPAAKLLYQDFRHRIVRWLAGKSLIGRIRIKFGTGEPMQRQGGYYDPASGQPVLVSSRHTDAILEETVNASAKRSASFARTPLRGIMAGGDFRTFQSNVFERLRGLTVEERSQVLFHIHAAQDYYEKELVRAAEPLEETRLSFQKKGLQELELLTRGVQDDCQDEFFALASRFFRQILYGREEDVLGIHVISYFISRSVPPLRDRPVVRPSREASGRAGRQVVERLAAILPLSRSGSMLRAIGHNRAQTMILGVNQLSTGLFRALTEFSAGDGRSGERSSLISGRILPCLPVTDILHTLRIYHEPGLPYLRRLEDAFPAGNSAFLALREDVDALHSFIPVLQKELLKRQGLDTPEFFEGDRIIGRLLPVLRPGIAVLAQPDLFNTEWENLGALCGDRFEPAWKSEMEDLLRIPLRIRHLRRKIWDLLYEPIRQQVDSFVGLALAVNTLSSGRKSKDSPLIREPGQIIRMGSRIADLLRGVGDDSMRQFLTAAVEYLVQAPQQMEGVPIEVLRALQDVEKIVRIEKQALAPKEQRLLRFHTLRMARVCGENG